MPIKPEKKKLYAANWKEIVAVVRKRSNDQCELCGAGNQFIIVRDKQFPANWLYQAKDMEPIDYYRQPIRVVLTVAHINQDPTDNRMVNLLHLCQRCHNRIDLPYRMDNAAKTRGRKTGTKSFLEGKP